jgi:hypothetical protein
MTYYILDNDYNPIETDIISWGKYMSTNKRVSWQNRDGVVVSTVFLGIDHSHELGSKPVLFETMVFEGEFDGEMERYCTWDEAKAGHEKMAEKVFGGAK